MNHYDIRLPRQKALASHDAYRLAETGRTWNDVRPAAQQLLRNCNSGFQLVYEAFC